MIDIKVIRRHATPRLERFASAGLLVAVSEGIAAITLRWDDSLHGDHDLASFARLADDSGCDGLLLIAVAPIAIELPGGELSIGEVLAVDSLSRGGARASTLRQVLRDGDGEFVGLADLRGAPELELGIASILDGIWQLSDDQSARMAPGSPHLH